MAITKVFDPETWLKQRLPASFRKKLLTKNLTLKRGIFQALIISSVVDKQDLREVINNSIDKYEKKLHDLEDDGVKYAKSKAVNGEKELKNRVENYLVYEESQAIKADNLGKKYIWLPSSSEEPRPEHQLKYGKEYTIGKGEFPNEAYGCKCGFMIID